MLKIAMLNIFVETDTFYFSGLFGKQSSKELRLFEI